jgi:drug/metabolite transporter (DMT)-like permease
MIPLLLSIVSSSFIFVIFKLFPRFGINTFQAIVFNYFTAFSCGVILFGNEWKDHTINDASWPIYALISGALFISLFILMGISSQKNGVALTSIAGKMSMAVSLIFMILIYREEISFLKTCGILLAFLGVFLVSFSKNNKDSSGSIWMLVILFLGSGLLDFVLNFVQKFHLKQLTPSLFSAFGFGIAGLIGSFVLVYQLITQRSVFQFRNVLAGIALGIPNYFSIFLMMLSYKTTGWTDSTVLAIINVSVVLLSAVTGFIAFKENVNSQKIIGLLSAVSAIIILYFASK